MLGPLFYMIYTNDLCESISEEVIQFADDCTAIISSNIQENLDVKIGSLLTKLLNYFSENRLTLNIEKIIASLFMNR